MYCVSVMSSSFVVLPSSGEDLSVCLCLRDHLRRRYDGGNRDARRGYSKNGLPSPHGMRGTSNEVHSYFGLSGTGYVNTKDEFTTQPLKSIAFSVPSNWSHTGLGGSDEDATGSTADNGIQVKVMQKDGEVHSIRTPGEGKVPQMLILPKGWEWPTECTRIDEAYPGFGEWGAGYLQGTGWLDTKNEGKVVEHHHVLIAPTVSEDAEH